MEKFFYRVNENETVFSLSQKFNIPPVIIVKENNLKKEIEVGDILIINKCNYTIYKVQPFDTIKTVAHKFNKTEKEILDKNNLPYLFYGLEIII